jgi:hypothetical protein
VYREGEEGLGAAQQREAWSGQGHGKGTTSSACRGLAVGHSRRVAHMSWAPGLLRGEGRWAVGGRSGGGSWRLAAGRHQQQCGDAALPWSGEGGGRGEKEERERVRVRVQMNFSQKFARKH